MATFPKVDLEQAELQLTRDQAVKGLYETVEGFFDDLGLSEPERDERYDKLRQRLNVTGAETSKT